MKTILTTLLIFAGLVGIAQEQPDTFGLKSNEIIAAAEKNAKRKEFKGIHPIVETKDTSKYSFEVDYEVGIATRNVWRGLSYGQAPSAYADLWLGSEYWDLGLMGTTTLNGNRAGYGTWMEIYTTFHIPGGAYITLDDYYFFNADTTVNNYDDYFNWTPNGTNHILELRLGWEYKEYFEIFASYPLYKNRGDNTNGVYLEATGQPWPFLSFTVAGLTGPSGLNFYDKGGVTTIAINGHKDLKIGKHLTIPLRASFIVNPNFKNAWRTYDNGAPTGVIGSPIYFVVAFTI